ncbi:hypothetical protein G5V57_20910 [Nordella sp. HKS 07]|uniref:RNA polymerase sigma factor region1.1 domain-containing protein n=1 Tax=Nordella sp. HKS 07 TaxID=2712222 RepID=UPI0013E0EBDD|nr:RNA polymerase sigma factor region1.1 domain-containing protein [Nordella sp. HKS 07]QIG49966.1 hypothetical protein G5V57_20910 [Nordella sp. HKS 07]
MPLGDATLLELIRLARQRGGISMEDLQKALPLESMSVEEISHIVNRLDEAGFDLELDPNLLSPKRKSAPQDIATVAKPEQTVPPEMAPERRTQSTIIPTAADKPIRKNQDIPRSGSPVPAHMLPWVAAFAIVVLAVFFAFAF